MAVQLSWSIVHETIHHCLCLIRWQIHGCNNNEGNKSYLNDASYSISISLAVVWVNEMEEVIWCKHVVVKRMDWHWCMKLRLKAIKQQFLYQTYFFLIVHYKHTPALSVVAHSIFSSCSMAQQHFCNMYVRGLFYW